MLSHELFKRMRNVTVRRLQRAWSHSAMRRNPIRRVLSFSIRHGTLNLETLPVIWAILLEELNQQLEAGEFDLGDFASNHGGHSWLAMVLEGITVKPLVSKSSNPEISLSFVTAAASIQPKLRSRRKCKRNYENSRAGFIFGRSHGSRIYGHARAPEIEKNHGLVQRRGSGSCRPRCPHLNATSASKSCPFPLRPRSEIVICASVDEARRALSEFSPSA